MHRYRVIAALCMVAVLGFTGACAPVEVTTSTLERGAVSAPESQAAEVGGEILRRGGNAVDAAIAVQFTIAVTNAIGAGIGGGGLYADP